MMFDDWIGRSWMQNDILSPGLLARFRSTIAGSSPDQDVPSGLHWCLAPPAYDSDSLGGDGHVAKGVDLPPIPLPRRMWASGEITFHAPFRVGDDVVCERHITDIVQKVGSTGPLYFVSVSHRYVVDRQVRIAETRTIVYREAAQRQAETASAATLAVVTGQPETVVVTDPVLLFRYSALTFNSHRIHYDAPYATTVEHYPGLVVHGPLQATWLMQLAERKQPGLRRFSYRAVNPLIVGASAATFFKKTEQGADLTVANDRGVVTMKASAQW